MKAISRSGATIPFPPRKISTKSTAKINVARHTGPFHAQVNTSRRLYSLFLSHFSETLPAFSVKRSPLDISVLLARPFYICTVHALTSESVVINSLSQMMGGLKRLLPKEVSSRQ
jgi:hypothetical protein